MFWRIISTGWAQRQFAISINFQLRIVSITQRYACSQCILKSLYHSPVCLWFYTFSILFLAQSSQQFFLRDLICATIVSLFELLSSRSENKTFKRMVPLLCETDETIVTKCISICHFNNNFRVSSIFLLYLIEFPKNYIIIHPDRIQLHLVFSQFKFQC